MKHRTRLVRALALPLAFVASSAPASAQPQAAAQARAPINQPTDPVLRAFRWRSIGPSGMGGRIDDIAVSESNPYVMYVGFAVGGLSKTTNNGVTWQPIFDTYSSASIGDIAIHPTNPDIVYVGTGEANNRQSSSFGDGMYKTTDGGRTFQHIGLRETQSIARIVIDPRNPDVVYVAAIGHLFGPNRERGVFKTTNGGQSWTNVKFIDENTGFTDLVMDATDSRTLYAASYQRRRTPFGFNGGGPGSAIWKTTDAGATWTKLTGNGLPSGTMGRIALDVGRSNPNVVYAQIEVRNLAAQVAQGGRGGGRGAGGAGGANPATTALEDLPDSVRTRLFAMFQQPGMTTERLDSAARAMGVPPGLIAQAMAGRGGGGGGRGGPPAPPDPTRDGVWRSDDKGRTWRFMSNNNNRPMYFSQIRVDPTNDQHIWTAGLPMSLSTDGGRTFRTMQGQGHVDQHAFWIDPKNGRHVIAGNDGGMDVSYDQGETWESIRTEAMGLFYQVSVDMRRPYYVCGGLQDNGSWCGPSAVRSGQILGVDWYGIGGGDGFWTQVDPTDWTTVYSESQNGNMGRYDLRTGRRVSIRPTAANIVPAVQNMGQLTYHWNTPLVLSPHDPQTVYTGSNRFHRSNDRGATWSASPVLSKAIDRNTLEIMGVRGSQPMMSKNDGVNGWGMVYSISESPAVPGLIWVGTDDGNVQLSRDGGATFTEVGKNMTGAPRDYYVTRIEASYHDPGTAYVTLDGHRNDDLKPYVYVTRDYGQTWQSLVSNLPQVGCVNVIKQDPKNRNLLYLGTEYAFYVSTDEGREWKRFMPNLPTVRIDDVVIHPRDGDLVLGTHGRSVWIMDDITPLQQWGAIPQGAEAHLFDVRPGVAWLNDQRMSREVTGHKNFVGENAPRGTAIQYYLRSAPSGNVALTVSDLEGKVLRTLQATRNQGLNRVQWNLAGDPAQGGGGGRGGGGGGGGRGGGGGTPLEPGTYVVKLTVGGQTLSKPVTVLQDVWMNER